MATLGSMASCSEEEEPGPVEQTSAFRPTGSTGGESGPTGAGVPGVTGLTGVLPTGPIGAATGNLSDGEVALNVTGDIRATKALGTIVNSVYAPPPGGMALVWTAGGADATTVGIGGLSFVGTKQTTPSLSLTITIQTQDTIATFISDAGECAITIELADAARIAGSFICADLHGGDGDVVDATGSFAAQG